ncbi:hypothetical protein [Isoptericola croceus]|uniref:hypothetical protein n=1 Tax=Isoptericola croceus TaxID=3031406 RepID=UPI0023F81EBE|nr:hypothetical protein [Isoptericola croceus]
MTAPEPVAATGDSLDPHDPTPVAAAAARFVVVDGVDGMLCDDGTCAPPVPRPSPAER